MLSRNLGILVLCSSGLALAMALAFGVTSPLFDPFSASGTYLCSGDYVAPDCGVDTPLVSVESSSMSVGETNSVDLGVFNFPEPGLRSWTIDIGYDNDLLTATDCNAERGGVCNENFSDNSVRITGSSFGGHVGDVNLGSVTFRCVAPGTSPLEVNVPVLADATEGNPQDVGAKTKNGEIICFQPALQPTSTPAQSPPGTSSVLGDVSCDGMVNAIDATLILQFTAGLLGLLPCHNEGDTTGDGSINSLDAALVLQLTAGLINSLPPSAVGNCSPSYPTVCIPPFPPDLNCDDIPFRRFTVLPPDRHQFDGDNDGVGCESG